jgi:hypothetical protein
MLDSISGTILNELALPISTGEIVVNRNSDECFTLISERFPIGINRIKWPANAPQMRFVMPSENVEKATQELRAFVAGAFQHFDMSAPEQDLFWIGDRTELTLKMKWEAFYRAAPVLFSYPQHAYVIPADASCCLNHTFEDDLYFGLALPSGKRPRKRNQRS